MTDRYTKVLLGIIAVASTLLLTSCSNSDTSGGVTLSRGGDDGNEFPYGSCENQGVNEDSGERTGCGWIHVNDKSYYITPRAELWVANLSGADLRGADLTFARLRDANLRDATLFGADLDGVKANSLTTCPNGIKWGTSGNNCPF